MEKTTIIGIIASAGTAISLLPQLVKIIKEKKAEGTSTAMILILLTGLGFWIYYGLVKDDWIIVVSNTIALLINISILVLSIVFKKKSGLAT